MDINYITNSFSYQGGGLVGAVAGLALEIQDLGNRVNVMAYGAVRECDPWVGLSLESIEAREFYGVHLGGGLFKALANQRFDLIRLIWIVHNMRILCQFHPIRHQQNYHHLVVTKPQI